MTVNGRHLNKCIVNLFSEIFFIKTQDFRKLIKEFPYIGRELLAEAKAIVSKFKRSKEQLIKSLGKVSHLSEKKKRRRKLYDDEIKWLEFESQTELSYDDALQKVKMSTLKAKLKYNTIFKMI